MTYPDLQTIRLPVSLWGSWQLITEDFQPVTAYQVSFKGMRLLECIPQGLRDEIDEIIFPPPGWNLVFRRLLKHYQTGIQSLPSCS